VNYIRVRGLFIPTERSQVLNSNTAPFLHLKRGAGPLLAGHEKHCSRNGGVSQKTRLISTATLLRPRHVSLESNRAIGTCAQCVQSAERIANARIDNGAVHLMGSTSGHIDRAPFVIVLTCVCFP